MNIKDQYIRFVRWSDEDAAYLGYCLDLFPQGAVCHHKDEMKAYKAIRQIVYDEIDNLLAAGEPLPEVSLKFAFDHPANDSLTPQTSAVSVSA